MWDEFDDLEIEGNEIPDPYVSQAKEKLREFFQDNKEVYPTKNLQVIFEKEFFHWVTDRAIKQLIDEGFLKSVDYRGKYAGLKFIMRSNLRYYRKSIKEKNSDH